MKKSHRTSRPVFLFCFCCDARSMLVTFGDHTNANVWAQSFYELFQGMKIWDICGHLQFVSSIFIKSSSNERILKKSFQKLFSELREVRHSEFAHASAETFANGRYLQMG